MSGVPAGAGAGAAVAAAPPTPPFTVDPALLEQARHIIASSITPGVDQAQVQQGLNEANAKPEFTVYLLVLLCHHSLPGSSPSIRQVAGLVAKANLERNFVTMPPHVVEAVKEMSLRALHDGEELIRTTACNIISTIVRQPRSIQSWPTLFTTLVALLDQPDPNIKLSAMTTLANICQDVGALIAEDSMHRALDHLLPRFIAAMESPNPAMRLLALQATLASIGDPDDDIPTSMITHQGRYVERLMALKTDADPNVRRVVCESLTTMLDRMGEFIVDRIEEVIEYMLHVGQTDVPNVRLQALEFWSSLCESMLTGSLRPPKPDHVVPRLNRLLPLLVASCQLSAEELADVQVENVDDSAVPDRVEDVRPCLYKVDGPAEVHQWTMRRCALAQLDMLSTTYKVSPHVDHVNTAMKEVLKSLFGAHQSDASWLIRDAGIMALGAYAQGAPLSMLWEFLEFLLVQLKDPRPVIRGDACWALGRAADPIAEGPEMYHRCLAAVLDVCRDRTKKVQEKAADALVFLFKDQFELLLPNLEKIMATVEACFPLYQQRNLLTLYDLVGQLAECVGDELQPYFARIMAPLTHKWGTVADDDDINLPPLMECLTFVIPAMGAHMAPHAASIYTRALRLLNDAMILVAASSSVEGEQPPDKVFVVATLDIIAALYEALHGDMKPIVAPSAGMLRPLLLAACADVARDVRLSAFALVGEMVVHTLDLLAPDLGKVVELVVGNMSLEAPRVCNNCCWVMGELAKAMGAVGQAAALRPLVPEVLKRLGPILNLANDQQMSKSLLQNVAVCMGRVAIVCTDLLVTLPTFLFHWLRCLLLVEEEIEREEGFCGAVIAMAAFPEPCMPCLFPMLHMLNSYDEPPPRLRDVVTRMFTVFKTRAAESFGNMLRGEAMDKDLAAQVVAKYGPVFS